MSLKGSLKRFVKYVIGGVPVHHVEAKVYQITAGRTLANKTIIVTGGGRGIGFFIAKKCMDEGATVIISGRNQATLVDAANKLGENCKILQHDVSDVENVNRFLSDAADLVDGKKIDCLVNNAGLSLHEGNYDHVTADGWNTQMDTNLKGSYFLTQAFVRQLEKFEDTSGNILFISSERGLYCDDLPYGLSKVAMNSFTQGLARRLISLGIRVNAIAPGVTVSEMTGYRNGDNLYRESSSGKRVLLPEEIAEVASFLLCDASSCISGEIIACDLGNYLRCDW